jgi:DNA-binding response OmpR family regulator
VKHNILYLDDNESLTSVVSEYLSASGYTVDCAHTVAEASRLFSQRVYSMVLIDLSISGQSLDGFEFACRLQDYSPWTPLMLFSACITPQVEVETIKRRIKIVSKPKPLPELRAIISAYLNEKYPRVPVRSLGIPMPVAEALVAE